MVRRVLFFASQIPQPKSTAASVRSFNLLNKLKQAFNIDELLVCTPTSFTQEKQEEFSRIVPMATLVHQQVNTSFDKRLTQVEPMFALFDTFVSEELYGSHVYRHFPQAISICDTQDLRSLRFYRQSLVMGNQVVSSPVPSLQNIRESLDDKNNRFVFSDEFMNSFPPANHPVLFRELSSILRCDLSLIVSSREKELLNKICRVPEEKLLLAPYIFTATDDSNLQKARPFGKRKNFVHIGTFKHAPNIDSVLLLKYQLWPQIRERLPDAQIHIYGSFIYADIVKLHSPAEGFIIRNAMPSISDMEKYRVNLAPLRYGAGIKGKIADGWQFGTPCVTTWVGAEGMCDQRFHFGGSVVANWSQFIDASVSLYQSEEEWNAMSKLAHDLAFHSDSPLSDTTATENITQALNDLLIRPRPDYLSSVVRAVQFDNDFKAKYLTLKQKIQRNNLDDLLDDDQTSPIK